MFPFYTPLICNYKFVLINFRCSVRPVQLPSGRLHSPADSRFQPLPMQSENRKQGQVKKDSQTVFFFLSHSPALRESVATSFPSRYRPPDHPTDRTVPTTADRTRSTLRRSTDASPASAAESPSRIAQIPSARVQTCTATRCDNGSYRLLCFI